MEILKVENVSKSFDNKKIINDVSFSVECGKIVGLLGKNGSGKTTILKMINDLLTTDSGSITIAGVKVSKKSKALVSFLPERTYLNGNQTVKQVFDFFEDFYADFDRKRAEELLSLSQATTEYLSSLRLMIPKPPRSCALNGPKKYVN